MTKCFEGRRGLALDGDTFRFSPAINGFHFVRLPNINTPEEGRVGFSQAKIDLDKLIRGKNLKICPRAIDRTRLIADVFVNGVDVTRAMKRKGW